MATPRTERPSASVVVPFRGDRAGAERLLDSLARLELGPEDEVIVADNSDEGVVPDGPVGVVRASGVKSSYFARNAGAREATRAWLVFLDSDCVPEAGLIDAYLSTAPSERTGALAGLVLGDPAQSHILARYATDRGFLDQVDGMHTAEDAAATANLAVRKAAFEAVGGFEAGVRSGGDVDLCRRLTAAGWGIERRPHAVVRHLHRESLRDLLRTVARYGEGARWLNLRYPGSAPQWPVMRGLAGAARDMAANLRHLRFEEAAFRGIDGMGLVAHAVGYRRSNRAR